MKKVFVIGLAVLMVLGLATMGMATDVDIVGSTAVGYVYIDAREYTGGNLGSHHSFDAWGSFDYNVDFSSAGSGMLDMNIPQAESQSHAGFQAIWRQDFVETDPQGYADHAGLFGLYAEGTGGATMNVQRGNLPYATHIKCESNYGGYKPISAEGTTGDLFEDIPGNQAYAAESWVESYDSYSDIGTTPPTDWSSIKVMGTGGEATIDFSGPYASFARDGGVEHDQFCTVDVDAGSGTYSRSVGGDNYVAWEGGTASSGGSGGMSFNYIAGYHANPWTIAK